MTTAQQGADERSQQDQTAAGPQDEDQQGSGEPDPRRWRVLWVCLVTGFMTLLDVSIVNVALPSIAQGVGASGSQLQWVLTGYAVAFGLALVPAGRLGDSLGRKRVFLVGLVVFALGSLGCGLAQGPWALVVARVVQGLGAGTLNPQISAIINSEFRGAERGRAFGLFGGTIGLSTAAGPLLGGLIIDFVPLAGPWRYVFLVNMPVALVAFVLGVRLISSRPSAGRAALDWVGTLLLGAAVVLVLLAIQERESLGWALAAGAVVVAAGLTAAFVRWERRYSERGGLPLARPGLMKAPGYAPGIVLGSLYFAGFTAIFFTVTLYLQDGLGYSPLQAGLTQTPFALASAVSAPLAGRWVNDRGRALVVRGLVLVVVGLLLALAAIAWVGPAVGESWTGLLLVVPFLVTGFGSGLVISPNVNLSLANIDRRDAGSASGVFQTFQRLGSGLGIALVGQVFYSLVSGRDYTPAVSGALVCTTALVLLSLVPAVVDVRRNPSSHAQHRASGHGGHSGRTSAHHDPAHRAD